MVLAVEDLVRRFGDIRAVDGVDFTVSKGDVLAFLGPNGAGKSTTMKIITGYLQADSGRVTYDGADIAEQPRPIKSRIGYLPEGVPMYGGNAGPFVSRIYRESPKDDELRESLQYFQSRVRTWAARRFDAAH